MPQCLSQGQKLACGDGALGVGGVAVDLPQPPFRGGFRFGDFGRIVVSRHNINGMDRRRG